MKYSAGQAAKATGKSIPTITRAIKNGVISASRKSGGGYEIDPAELHRKFPAVTSVSDVIVTELGRETPIIPNALQDKVKMLEEALADVRDDRDHWRQQATALLTHQQQRPPTETARPSFWRRLTGSRMARSPPRPLQSMRKIFQQVLMPQRTSLQALATFPRTGIPRASSSTRAR